MTTSECISLLELLKKEMQFDPCMGDKEILEIQALDEAIKTLRFYLRLLPAEQPKLHGIELEQEIKKACRVKWHCAPYLDDRFEAEGNTTRKKHSDFHKKYFEKENE